MHILLAGGGTGGHLFPAIALAEEINERYPGTKIGFVGTRQGLEARVIPLTPWDLFLMDVPQLKGMGLIRKITTIALIPYLIVSALRALGKIKPDIVIGVGGYASGPIVIAAYLRRIPAVTLEQNVIPGMTNRLLKRFVKRVFVMFPESARFFKNAVVTGNPVRKRITTVKPIRRDGVVLLVFGGSQGAAAINKAMLEVLPQLEEIREDIHVVHQVGRSADINEILASYHARGFSAEVHSFIEDMGRYYAMADLVVARAGATSIAELMMCGKPAILIPYPYAADNHQEANARVVEEAGGAVVVLEGEISSLGERIKELISDPQGLAAMGDAMRAMARPEAARIIVEECWKLIETPNIKLQTSK